MKQPHGHITSSFQIQAKNEKKTQVKKCMKSYFMLHQEIKTWVSLTTFLTRSLAAGVPPETDSGKYGVQTLT